LIDLSEKEKKRGKRKKGMKGVLPPERKKGSLLFCPAGDFVFNILFLFPFSAWAHPTNRPANPKRASKQATSWHPPPILLSSSQTPSVKKDIVIP